MFKYHTKLVGRNSRKHKRFFFISILSLAIGIATSFLLWMHINYEKSYDQFYPKSDDLYRISYNLKQNGKQLINSACTPTALCGTLTSETSLVETSSRVLFEECYMHTENVKLFNQKVLWADSTFLRVFQLPMVLGDIESSLTNKYSVVISDKIASIYFGQENPIGQIVKLNEGIPFAVTGVFKELPPNTHLSYDFVVSFHTLEDYGINRNGSWNNNWLSTYIRAKHGTSPKQIEAVLANMADKYMADRKERDQEVKFSLLPIRDIYLYTDLEGEFRPQGNSTKISLLTIIALFVIVIAWANNINISTALSFERAKQSGIRKINGANNKTIFHYFIIESFYINLTAIFVSLVFLFAAFPAFKSMVNNSIGIGNLFQIKSLVIIGFILITGVAFTGVLPAIIQSSFQAIHVLRSKNGNNIAFNNFRKSLTVFQFTLAIILVSSTLLIFKQLKYMESTDLGIKARQVLVMRAPSTNNTTGERRYIEYKSFRKDLLQSPYFAGVTATMNIPGQTNRYKNVLVSKNAEQINASFNKSLADESYFETYQVPFVEGRNFSDIIENERNSIIINEKAVDVIGFESSHQAIGQYISVQNREKKIIGVVKNFHHESLQKELEPYIYEFNHPHEFGYYPALIETSNIPEAIRTAKKVWANHYPDALPDFFFLDEFFNKQYVSYHQLGKLVGTSSILAIVIACLGLFALASYTVNKKVKEIGVRKVNGATILEMLTMLNKDFVKWVAIAFVIAVPVAYYAMQKWLEYFAYKTTLSWWIFAITGLLALWIALLTVSWQSWRAATRNPVEALRYE